MGRLKELLEKLIFFTDDRIFPVVKEGAQQPANGLAGANQASTETGRSESPQKGRATSLPGVSGIQTQVDGSYKKAGLGAAEVIRLPIGTLPGTRTS